MKKILIALTALMVSLAFNSVNCSAQDAEACVNPLEGYEWLAGTWTAAFSADQMKDQMTEKLKTTPFPPYFKLEEFLKGYTDRAYKVVITEDGLYYELPGNEAGINVKHPFCIKEKYDHTWYVEVDGKRLFGLDLAAKKLLYQDIYESGKDCEWINVVFEK